MLWDSTPWPGQDFLRTTLWSEALLVGSFLPRFLLQVSDLHPGLRVLPADSCFLSLHPFRHPPTPQKKKKKSPLVHLILTWCLPLKFKKNRSPRARGSLKFGVRPTLFPGGTGPWAKEQDGGGCQQPGGPLTSLVERNAQPAPHWASSSSERDQS